MQIIKFVDRLESGKHAWVSLASMLLYAALATGAIVAAQKRQGKTGVRVHFPAESARLGVRSCPVRGQINACCSIGLQCPAAAHGARPDPDAHRNWEGT